MFRNDVKEILDKMDKFESDMQTAFDKQLVVLQRLTDLVLIMAETLAKKEKK